MKAYKFVVGALGTNCYIVADEESKKCIVIDPGDDLDKIIGAVSSKELTVSAIVLTHAHFDHILALEQLRKHTKAPVLVHEGDGVMLTDPSLNLMERFSSRTERISPADRLLKDGDAIELGSSKLTVMHTPGHTKGSICLLADGMIFTGDTLFRENIGRYDFPSGDYQTLMESLQKLAMLDGDYKIYSGHGPSTHLSYERENNIYLK